MIRQSLTLVEHLHELRRRLFTVSIVLIVGMIVGYIFRNTFIEWGSRPLNLPLYYNNPAGGLQFVLQVCFGVGIACALPFVIYNLIRFVEPAFGGKSLGRFKAFGLMIISSILGLAGILFAYYIILPMSFRFFGDFNVGGIKPLISTGEYFSFTAACLIIFALIFQIPLLLLFFNSMKRFPPGKLRQYWRHTYVGSFVVALVLPFTYDPVTQFVVAIPIIVLYEISAFLLWLINRGKMDVLEPVRIEAGDAGIIGEGNAFDRRRPIQLG